MGEAIKFNKSFEETILAKTLKDVKYLQKASRILDSHHFNTKAHSWVWKTIKKIWDEYREQPSKKLMLAKVKTDFSKSKDREIHRDLLKDLYRKKTKDSGATLEELSRFVRFVNAQLVLEEAANDLEKGNIEKVYESIRKLSNKDLKPKSYDIIEWIEGFKERQQDRRYRKEHPEEFVRVPTGFKKLDNVIGGIEKGELGMILATTGKGKSIMLNNIAFNAVKRGYKVVYFALEMPARQIAQRQDARWLGMPYKKFKEYDFSASELREIDRKLKKVSKKWKEKFCILSMPIRQANANTVRSALDDLWEEKKFRPDLIIMDSADHLKGVGRYESYRLEQSENYWLMKGLALEEGYAIWTSTQAPKEWAKEIATAEAAGESYDKARICDIMLSINTPEKKTRSSKVRVDVEDADIEATEDLAKYCVGTLVELYLAKYRDGQSKLSIPIDADFSKMLMSELDVE